MSPELPQQTHEQEEEVEVRLLKPEANIPETDQRTHVVLTDERFLENLARCPRGLQGSVSAVMMYIKGCMDEIVRLKKMEKLAPDKRGNIRVLKDTTTYYIRRLKPCVKCAAWDQATATFSLSPGCEHQPAKHPERVKRSQWSKLFAKPVLKPKPLEEDVDYVMEERRVGIYTVLPAVQVPHYRRKFERQTAQAIDWVYRMMRLWIGEDGKGRIEMIDALQASNGKLMPSENGRIPMINILNGEAKQGGWPKSR
jgi:hypothetical protein